MTLSALQRTLQRHMRMKSFSPYQRALRAMASRGDIWMVSQGRYLDWWQRRQRASLRLSVSNGICSASTDLENAVLERFPQEFLACKEVDCPDSHFTGELQWVIDATLGRKHLLIEALRREGIMNFAVGGSGEFTLSHELEGVLERMEHHLRRLELTEYHRAVLDIRDMVAERLAQSGLPLVRLWYHPRVEGRVIKAAFSARHDVDRAITNLPRVLQLEQSYNAKSTLYLRVFQPFYSDGEMREMVSWPHTLDIGLHAELDPHSQGISGQEATIRAAKAHLEEIFGRPVEGVSQHGGELTRKPASHYRDVVESSGFLWSASNRNRSYCFPYRWLKEDGQLSATYGLCTHFRDVKVPSQDYDDSFYELLMGDLEEALRQNGVLVPLFHPVYFGSLAYLLVPRNLGRLLRFMPTYLGRLLKQVQNQSAS